MLVLATLASVSSYTSLLVTAVTSGATINCQKPNGRGFFFQCLFIQPLVPDLNPAFPPSTFQTQTHKMTLNFMICKHSDIKSLLGGSKHLKAVWHLWAHLRLPANVGPSSYCQDLQTFSASHSVINHIGIPQTFLGKGPHLCLLIRLFLFLHGRIFSSWQTWHNPRSLQKHNHSAYIYYFETSDYFVGIFWAAGAQQQ